MKKRMRRRAFALLVFAILFLVLQCIPIVNNDASRFSILTPATVFAKSTSKKMPVKLTVKARSYSSLTLSWKKVKGAKGYDIYRAASPKGKYKKIKRTTKTSYINTSLKTGTAYYYKVRAYTKSKGKTKYGSYSSYKKGIPVPAVSSKVSVVSYTYASTKISWNAVSGATGYELYRAVSRSGKYSRIKTTSARSYVNTSLTTGRLYYYKIRAYKTVKGKKIYGSYTQSVSGKAILSKPSIVVTSTDYNTIKLSWKSVSGASGYELYRASSLKGPYVKLKTITAKSYTNTGLSIGNTYYYKIRAYRTIGSNRVYSSYSSITRATANLSTPVVKTISTGYRSAKISWNAIPGATGYVVYQATSKTGTYTLLKNETDTMLTIENLTPDKTYYYKVRAYRTSGKQTYYSSFSAISSVTPKLGMPSVRIQNSSDSALVIEWPAIKDAVGYEVLRSSSINGNYTNIGTTNSTSYKDSKVMPGTAYYYKVRATASIDDKTIYSSYSSPIEGITVLSQPAFTLKEMEINAAHRVTLSIDQKVRNAGGYAYYVNIDGKGYVQFATTNSETLKATYTVKDNQRYQFKVRAYATVNGKKIYGSYAESVSYRCEWFHADKIYEIGKDIPEGIYYFQKDVSDKNILVGSIAISFDPSVSSDNLEQFEWVSISRYQLLLKGDYLKIENVRFISEDKAPYPVQNEDGSYGNRTYKVGRDIPAGKYTITGADKVMFGSYEITSGCRGDEVPHLVFIDYGVSHIVTLKEGDYLETSGVLTYPEVQ